MEQEDRAPLLGSRVVPESYGVSGPRPVVGLESPAVYRSRWRSIRVIYLTMFLASIGFSICMSSIWPYLQEMSPGVTTTFLGWVVAAYSLGQLLASPLFGLWANRSARCREPLVTSILLYMASNVLYGYVQDITSHRAWFVLIARAGIGFGAGNGAVCRSYVAGATTLGERTAAMAGISASQAVGFIIGPAIQAALAPLKYPGPVTSEELYLNMYTAPALLSTLLGLLNIVLLICFFSEHTVHDDLDLEHSRDVATVTSATAIQSAEGDDEEEEKANKEEHPDYLAVLALNLLIALVFLIFSVFETMGTPLAQDMFGWSNAEATLYLGIILACLGVMAIGVFMSVKVLSTRINERYILIGGFVVMLLGLVAFLPWGPHHPPQPWTGNVPGINVTTPPLPPNATLSAASTTALPNGCPYPWCAEVPGMSLWQYLLATVLVGAGYPVTNLVCYAIYSKVLGPSPQGLMMGMFVASASLARAVGPVVVTSVYDRLGTRVSFLIMIGLATLALTIVAVTFRRLVPYAERKRPRHGSDVS